jgi:general stress protein YciG
MDPAKQRAIASKGGSSVPPEKRPFAQNHRLAAEAGRKGGENSHGGRKPVPADPPEPASE